MTNTQQILKTYWNHDSFRAPQDKIIEAVLNKENVIALLPTGGGKSICFQIPALINEGVCIVVSPLIALMQDQVDSLNEKGVKALALVSGTDQDDLIAQFDNIRFGNYKFLYLSPERLQSIFIQDKIKQLNVNLIAIDEAHCISEWGHDFRPSYRNINVLKSIKPDAPIIALTATATKKVIEDISDSLELKDPSIFKKSFYRENLAYQFFNTEDKLQRLIQICTKTIAPIIIYASSRNRTKEIATFLNANNFKASFYHGGLTPNEKQASFDNWISEKTPIIVATNAFGMGIDKSNVRVVVHVDLPNSIENYIQEAGRAGRDGKKAFSAVLYNANDIRISLEKIKTAFPSIQEIKSIYKSLFQNYRIANGELLEDSFEFNLLQFSNTYKYNSAKVDTTLRLLHNNGIVDISNNYNKKSTVQFLATSNQVLNYTKANNTSSKLIKLLLRSYGGVFEQETKINEFWLSKKVGILSFKVVEILEQLHAEEIIDYKKATKNADLYFLIPREDDKTINSISKNITKYIQQKIKKSEDILQLVKNDTVCRSSQILVYFNEATISECGMCDVCLKKKSSYSNVSANILNYLNNQKEANSHQICNHISSNEANVLVNLQQLLSEEIIAINNYNQYHIK
jgi:ATP-dependent DNA helicase RecQ